MLTGCMIFIAKKKQWYPMAGKKEKNLGPTF